MCADRILHHSLDHTVGTALFWSYEDLPPAPRAFFVLRRGQANNSFPQELNPAELTELDRLLGTVKEAIGIRTVEPIGIQLMDPNVAEKIGIQKGAAQGINLFVIAVGAAARWCVAEGWTDHQFRSAITESALLDEWGGGSDYLEYALKRLDLWPWYPNGEGGTPFPKGTVVQIDGQTLALVPVNPHRDHVYLAFTRDDWKVLSSFKRKWRKRTVEKVASFGVMRSGSGHWSYRERGEGNISDWKLAKPRKVGSAFELWNERTSS